MRLDIDFVWDEEKAKLNLQKHGISFETARRVFADEYRIEYYDLEHSDYEDRFITIGSAGDTVLVLFVVFTERNRRIRIISARKADKRERRMYYGRKYDF